jgi:L-ascorbate 6-phosphate lactonase
MNSGKKGQDLVEEVDSTNVPYGECVFWWLGQHGFILKMGTTVLYVDAYLSPSEGRNVPPLVSPEEVTNADGILGTHDHGDHIDGPSWSPMGKASPHAIFVTPLAVRNKVMTERGLPEDRVIGLDDGISTAIGGVTITAVPAAHEFLSIDPKTGGHEFLGLVFEGNGVCVYHAGDTCIYEGIQNRLRQWSFDLAFLPINGRDGKRLKSGCIGNMTFQEAVDLAGSLRPGLTIPTHFEMFNGNTENPQLFMEYIEAKYPALNATVPIHGLATIVSTHKKPE